MEEDKEKKEEDVWEKRGSRRNPRQILMYNKTTDEYKWMAPEECPESEQIRLAKTSKTPAQDRLRRLQYNLKAAQNCNHNTKSICLASNFKLDSKKEQENINDRPSTSSSHKSLTKSPKKAVKRPQSSNSNTDDETENENETKAIKTTLNDRIKKQKLMENPTNSTNSTTDIKTEPSNNSKLPTDTEEFKKAERGYSSTFSNIRTGILNKIKSICKLPFSGSKSSSQEKSKAKDEETGSISLVNTNSFKASKRIRESQNVLSHSVHDAIVRELKSNSDTIALPTTAKSLNIPTYPGGSANSRLERLKQSLLLNQKQQQQPTPPANDNTNATETSQIPTSICDSAEEAYNLSISEDNKSKGNSNNPLQNTTSNVNTDETEAMDWQPIARDEEEVLNKSTDNSIIDSGFIIKKSKKCPLIIDPNDNQTMGDIYDTVNENLLRISAEKEKGLTIKSQKWKKDFYYFIVDTNVLLRDLTFVEDLTKMKLCDTKGSMLYIPYTVLQELDKLKMRCGGKQGIRTLAVRAIKYLNEKFENNSVHIKAQSALAERKHLIDVISPDDSILNCCLQAKKYVKNTLLLTEDVNLRNKAICNNILVSTKSDLVSKRYDLNNQDKTL